jgi:hypothetical protein
MLKRKSAEEDVLKDDGTLGPNRSLVCLEACAWQAAIKEARWVAIQAG